MLYGKVVSNIVSTRKCEKLIGSTFFIVELYKNNDQTTGEFIVAIDSVGAGISDKVLITTGSSARLALHNDKIPTDMVIVGIVD